MNNWIPIKQFMEDPSSCACWIFTPSDGLVEIAEYHNSRFYVVGEPDNWYTVEITYVMVIDKPDVPVEDN